MIDTKLNHDQITKLMIEIEAGWNKRCRDKGYQIYNSRHEGLGVLAEEYHELLEAIRKPGTSLLRAEALDCVIPLLHLIASIDTGQMEW